MHKVHKPTPMPPSAPATTLWLKPKQHWNTLKTCCVVALTPPQDSWQKNLNRENRAKSAVQPPTPNLPKHTTWQRSPTTRFNKPKNSRPRRAARQTSPTRHIKPHCVSYKNSKPKRAGSASLRLTLQSPARIRQLPKRNAV